MKKKHIQFILIFTRVSDEIGFQYEKGRLSLKAIHNVNMIRIGILWIT